MNESTPNYTHRCLVLPVPDFASALSLRASTVRKWLVQGRLAKVKLGRRTMIPVTEIDRLIAENLIPAANPQHGYVMTKA